MRFNFFDGFTVECNKQVQHAMCRRMLRSYINHQDRLVLLLLLLQTCAWSVVMVIVVHPKSSTVKIIGHILENFPSCLSAFVANPISHKGADKVHLFIKIFSNTGLFEFMVHGNLFNFYHLQ